MPVMHKLDCRISDPSSHVGEFGPREYVPLILVSL